MCIWVGIQLGQPGPWNLSSMVEGGLVMSTRRTNETPLYSLIQFTKSLYLRILVQRKHVQGRVKKTQKQLVLIVLSSVNTPKRYQFPS